MKKLRKVNHRIYNLSDFDDYSNISYSFFKFLQDNINQFTTSSNPSITSYLQNKALLLNQQNSLRTYFIVDTDTLDIIGYFCLKIVNINTNISILHDTDEYRLNTRYSSVGAAITASR
ncbi:hypothetical protein GCM10007342_17220 [Staphylococcus pragensis]|nr:hypothetical protein GCM10007342_17220 [Staphylococcus pragensis]